MGASSHQPSPTSIIWKFQVHSHKHKYTSGWSGFRCSWTTTVEWSPSSSPSAWFVVGHVPPKT